MEPVQWSCVIPGPYLVVEGDAIVRALEAGNEDDVMVAWDFPKSVDEAVDKLIEELPLKDRVYIAGLEQKDLGLIHGMLGSYIRQDFGLFRGNRELIRSCRKASGIPALTADQVPLVIMKALWEKLKATHALRVVKNEEPPSGGQ